MNTSDVDYPTSSIATETWSAMESAGCVFLPAAGYRGGSDVGNVGSYGSYWSSTPNGTYYAYFLYFNSGNVYPSNDYDRYCVRLVCSVSK